MVSASNGVLLRGLLILLSLPAAALFPGPLSAMETASLQINHIPLAEAKALAQTRLSPAGRLSTLPSRSLLIIIDKQKNIEKVRRLLQRFDVPTPRVRLSLQIMSVSTEQSRLWAREEQHLPGGWKLIPNRGPIKHRLIVKKEIWLHPDKGIRVETGSVRPIRQDIRNWLEQHGVPDSPDLMLHPIYIGLTVYGRLKNNNRIRLTLNPWLRIIQPPGITAPAQIEVLPDLGTTSSPKQPPSTVAPVRLNIQPRTNAGFHHDISLAGANTEIDISAGQPVTLLASEEEAKALGAALLSKTINGQRRLVVFRLLLERIF